MVWLFGYAVVERWAKGQEQPARMMERAQGSFNTGRQIRAPWYFVENPMATIFGDVSALRPPMTSKKGAA